MSTAAAPLAGWRSELRLVWSWSRRELNARYRQSALRSAWTVLQPISLVVVYGLVFRNILDVDGDGLPYLSFVVAGVVVYRYFALGVGQISSLVDNAHVISKVYFRREVLPLSICVGGLVDLAIGVVLLVGVATAQGEAPGLTLVAVPLPLLVMVLLTSALCVTLSAVAVVVRDVVHAVPTLLQVMFFASPVMYPTTQYPPGFGALGEANPLAACIEAVRDVTLRQTWPDWGLLAIHLAVAAGAFAASLAYVRSIEHRLVDVA